METKVLGSQSLQTSTANMEIIPSPPDNWTVDYQLNPFSFMNDQDCTVRINGSDPIFLRAKQGFNLDHKYKTIRSFVIVEPEITFNWIGIIY